MDLSNMAGRWAMFGWRVSEVDGHSIAALTAVLCARGPAAGPPHVVLAKTVFGKGVSFMEQGHPGGRAGLAAHPINWHYLPMSAEEFDAAMKELDSR
jgi:transketolase